MGYVQVGKHLKIIPVAPHWQNYAPETYLNATLSTLSVYILGIKSEFLHKTPFILSFPNHIATSVIRIHLY